MDKPVDIRALDEWMYAINTALVELKPTGSPEAVALLQRTLDDMRERRAQLLLWRQNERGY
jgi:hypothetical protein